MPLLIVRLKEVYETKQNCIKNNKRQVEKLEIGVKVQLASGNEC